MANFSHLATGPLGTNSRALIDSEWPILAVLQLSNIFLMKWSQLIENGQFLAILQLFQYAPTEVIQIDLEWPISWLFSNFSNIFLMKWSELIENGKFYTFCNFSNIFLLKWSKQFRMAYFRPFCNFSSIFLPKSSKLTQNGQFWTFCKFAIFSY